MDTDQEHSEKKYKKNLNLQDIGTTLFQYRDYTPIPLIILLLFTAEPTVFSVTLGLICAFIGQLIRLYSVAFIGGSSRTRSTKALSRLVDEGPFGVVRNPLYVGNFFMTVGICIYGGVAWVAVVGALLFIAQYIAIVSYEERLLRAEFGEAYDDYCMRVPPWLPRRWPKLEELKWPETFSPALKSEKRTLTAFGLMVLALLLLA